MLARQGVPRRVVLSGHGGKDFRQHLRELRAELPQVFLSTVNWFRTVDRPRYCQAPGDYADALETGALLHIAPALVQPLVPGSGQARQLRIAAFRQGRDWAQREWSQVTADTGADDPATKGATLLAEACRAIGQFLTELAQADPHDLYA